MNMQNKLQEYTDHLWMMERSDATIQKYGSVVRRFLEFVGERALDKAVVMEYKEHLRKTHSAGGINTMLAAVNGFLKFIERTDCCVKNERIQRQIYISEERELTQTDCKRLLAAGMKKRIWYIMRCMCATGIRVSELPYITVEAVKTRTAIVRCKNKTRKVFLPKSLCKLLKDYARNQGIKSGSIFVSRNGKPLFRTTIWKEMKALCEAAGVASSKVFPHNLRHLFARMFYQAEKDIVKLSDLLGHASIQTTRLYIISSGKEHREGLERMDRQMNEVFALI